MPAKNHLSRRRFLLQSGAFSALLGTEIVFHKYLPPGLLPVALAETNTIAGKDPGLVVLNDRPLNAETPAHLLDDKVTPASRLFVRNNGIPPEAPDSDNWTLTISGESVEQEKSWTIQQLKDNFKHYSYQLTIECGGNGRAEFNPPAKGNQWTTGAVGCPKWTGVRLKDVLQASGIKPDAVYIGYYGADKHLSGDPGKFPISRGVPIHKALEDEALIAWAMNDEPLPLLNGFPLRLVFGGWPASTSGKWLQKIAVRNQIHDGAKMTGTAYRVPCNPVAPGSTVDETQMCIIEAMPVKSLITFPKSGVSQALTEPMLVRGHAWAGDKKVTRMQLSIDFGQTWLNAPLSSPVNKNAWQHWQHKLRFPKPGYYEIWAKATDDTGVSQPMVLPGWNPKGYLNNATHRIAVQVI
ncbi:sulfite oxidase [Planctobacterium marinum]|uniref:sulfite oxidase n=1 Tax=Planctobacterium marinum TaxID=1631968 RepID=UPI001E32D932|nr:sulfite oxidase [Planctobacterium marinum]MCC2607829.1 sulfite oxidase [Planctobacterium marinum]